MGALQQLILLYAFHQLGPKTGRPLLQQSWRLHFEADLIALKRSCTTPTFASGEEEEANGLGRREISSGRPPRQELQSPHYL